MSALSEQRAQCAIAREWFHGGTEEIAFAYFDWILLWILMVFHNVSAS